jgi:hypothetical protein
MKRLLPLILTASLAACSDNKPAGPGGGNCGGTIKPCERSSDCDRGDICDKTKGTTGCCTAFAGCTPDSCPSGKFCDDDFICKTIADKCLIENCECHILNAANQVDNSGDPQFVLPPTAARKLVAVLATAKGLVLPNASFTYSLPAGQTAFTLSGTTVTATATAALTPITVTADAGNNITPCHATLVNPGPVSVSSMRVLVFDDASGKPIENALVIPQDADGNMAATSYTDDKGIAEMAEMTSAYYSLTVFAEDFNYVSLVGLEGLTDVAIPMAREPFPEQTAGFSGKVDLTTYHQLRADRDLKATFTGGSFPLVNFLNFQPRRLVGTMPSVSCADVDSSGKHAAGCYSVDIPGLTAAGGTWAPLPGGLSITYGTTPIKSSFDSVALAEARRYAWTLGTDIKLSDVAKALDIFAPYFKCACDHTPKVCDKDGAVDCACDLDCPLRVNFGDLIDTIIPELPEFASGVIGNLPLTDVAFTEWQSYVATKYDSRAANAKFPKLDTGTDFGPIDLREIMNVYTDYTAGALPLDPNVPGQQMEGLAVVTGVDTKGYGFVPLGFGVGVDCTSTGCLDRAAHPGDFDGHVNGSLVCLFDVGNANRCDDIVGLPADGRIGRDHLGVFHAKAHSGLEDGEWITLAAAIPVSSYVMNSQGGIRATAFVLRSQPQAGAQMLDTSKFPAFPTMQASMAGARTYTITPIADADIQWVTFTTDSKDDADDRSFRWNVYFNKPASGTLSFTAPPVPTGLDSHGKDWLDPVAPSAAGGDVEAGMVLVTHVGFKLKAGVTFTKLAGNTGETLVDLPKYLEGITLQYKSITGN